MSYVIQEFSKYIVVIAMGLYLFESVWPLFKVRGDQNQGVYTRQLVYIILVHSLSMATLYLTYGDPQFLQLFVAQLMCLFLFNRLTLLIYQNASKMLLNHMSILLVIGFVELSRLDPDKAFRQFIIICFSLAIFMIIPFVIKKFSFIPDYGVLYGTLGIVLLGLVFTLGKTSNGSKLSYKIFGLAFQPSEFVKILFVLFVAAMLYETTSFIRILITTVVAVLYVGILVLSKDLGSALIFFVVYIAMLFVATGKPWYSLAGLGAGGLGAVAAYNIFTHVQTRVAVWLDPWSDIDRTGYQITQSLFAIGTGGWMGMGLGKGEPKSIPFVDEDFMFSAICEEYGVIFGIILILIYLAIFVLLLKNTLRTKDTFYRLVQVGLSTILCIQTFLTIGGGSRLIPLTGVTLPLVSNGGSSAMSTIMLFGICVGISILPKKQIATLKNASLTGSVANDTIDDESGSGLRDELYEEEQYTEELYKEDSEDDEPQEENGDSSFYSDPDINKKRINAYILTAINAVLFIALIVNLITYMYRDKDEAISNDYNIKRQELIAAGTVRGSILASDGTVLAETVVNADGTETRRYPYGDEYCHVVGYSTYGKTGIEDYMNMYLINSNISFSSKTENGFNGEKNPGDQVVTTLVPELQDLARESLGLYKGAIIATKVETGEILAMVSTPGFDPNTIDQEFENISVNDTSSVLLNRASQGLYPPGSTFKIIDSLEYIRENPDTYKNYTYNCNGYYKAGDTVIHCFKNHVHGYQDIYASLANSCNSSYANIGMKLNKLDFADTLTSLLFNSDLPVDFESNQSHVSVRDYMSDEELAQTSIGQGDVLMTPLHLNMITQAIANDGLMMKPYLVSEVKSVEGNSVKSFGPTAYGRIASEQEAEVLQSMLKNVIDNGTAKKLRDQEFTAAGKTGSAEFNGDGGESHAWFTGYAPAENPQICVTVILEGAGTGGDYSVPITRRMFAKYFELYGMPEEN